MQQYTNDKFTLVLFVIYTIFYESLVWGLTAGAIYFLDWSPYTVLVSMIVSSSQLKYRSFYVKIETPEKSSDIELELDLGKK